MVGQSSTATAPTFGTNAARRSVGQGRYIITDVLHASTNRALLVGCQVGLPQPVLIERITGLSKATLARTLDHAPALLALAHPNLARVIACFVEDAALHVVMVAGPGTLLGDPRGIVNQHEAIAIGIQICNALGHLAWRGIHHAPHIDPTTVYLTTAGRVKLTSMATLLGVRAARRSPLAAAHQQTPLYSVGATLHHVLTGWPTRAVADAPPLVALRPDFAPAYCVAIERALAPVNAWPSLAALRYALLQIPE